MSAVRIVVCCVLLGTAPAFAQSGWDNPPSGSAVIRGHVRAAGSLQPLARAEVVLEGQTRSNAVFADEHGWFEFNGLPSGRYTVRAARAGYLTTHYGQADPAEAAQSIELADGEVRGSIDVRLPLAGVIVVTVVDEFGAPIEGAFVQAQTARIARGQLTLGYTTNDRQGNHATDDRGRLRLFDLPPGEYYVSAALPAVPRRISDSDRRQNASRLPTFHPGTVWLNDAEPVALDLGQEVRLTLAVVPTRVALVSGQVIREDGTVLRPYSLAMKRLVKGRLDEPLRHPRMTGDDFEFADLPPGQYRIEYHSDPSDTSTSDAGVLDVTVGGFDLTGVVVTAKPAAVIQGRIVPEQGTGLATPLMAVAQPPAALEPAATVRLSGRVVSAEGDGPIEGAFVRLVSGGVNLTELTDALGVYEFSGLKPGSYSLSCDKTGYLVRGQKVGLLAMTPQRKVEIRTGQSLRETDLPLERWGVIAVHVTDDLGIPHARVEVRALSVTGSGNDRKLSRPPPAVFSSPNFTSAKEFETDDKGDARIYGLAAGDYIVVARPRGLPIVGQGPSDRDVIFPPLYHPGEVSAVRAEAMPLRAGGELSVDIKLTPARTAAISGRVARSDGFPGRGFVILRWNPAGVLYPANLIGDVLYRADLVDGRFLFDSLAPGDYLVETSDDRDSREFDGEASIAVTVNGEDVSDVFLSPKP